MNCIVYIRIYFFYLISEFIILYCIFIIINKKNKINIIPQMTTKYKIQKSWEIERNFVVCGKYVSHVDYRFNATREREREFGQRVILLYHKSMADRLRLRSRTNSGAAGEQRGTGEAKGAGRCKELHRAPQRDNVLEKGERQVGDINF